MKKVYVVGKPDNAGCATITFLYLLPFLAVILAIWGLFSWLWNKFHGFFVSMANGLGSWWPDFMLGVSYVVNALTIATVIISLISLPAIIIYNIVSKRSDYNKYYLLNVLCGLLMSIPLFILVILLPSGGLIFNFASFSMVFLIFFNTFVIPGVQLYNTSNKVTMVLATIKISYILLMLINLIFMWLISCSTDITYSYNFMFIRTMEQSTYCGSDWLGYLIYFVIWILGVLVAPPFIRKFINDRFF